VGVDSSVELSKSQWSIQGPILGPGAHPAAAPLLDIVTLPTGVNLTRVAGVTAAQIPGNGKLRPAIPGPSVIDL
jgi:hypothetical protein